MQLSNLIGCISSNGALRGAVLSLATLASLFYNSTLWAGGEPNLHVVEIKGGKFVPQSITVEVGDTIRWINRDYIPHTATAKDTADDGPWDTGNLNREDSGEIVFEHIGHMDYLCIYHPVMTGEVIVVDRMASRRN